MLTDKIVRFKKIYKFDFDHFLIKCTVFVLIVKNVIKNQNHQNAKRYEARNTEREASNSPILVTNSKIFGVNLKGTGLFASRSPVVSSTSNLKYATFINPES